MPDEDPDSDDVDAWFSARGFSVRVSDHDYSEDVRSSPFGRDGLTRDHHVWVDLLASDGHLMQGGYGSGDTPDEAMKRARERYQQEQGG